ncbi:MAG: glycosyltransferase [Nitrospirae bacterium]|nr:glycosyltransferase [Nitrospirota bacterium]
MNRQNPLISIIVRTKDRPNLLKRVFTSISAQTYTPLEVILVNDGGCDIDTEDLKGLLDDIPLNYLRLESNHGRAFAANTGIKNASGEYICFLDDDDEYYPEHVSTLFSAAIQGDYGIVYTDALKVRRRFNAETGQMEEHESEIFGSYDFSYIDLITENYIPLTTILFTKRILLEAGGFDRSFELYEDWDLLLRVAEKHPPFHIPKVTVKYIFWDRMYQISQSESERHKYYHRIFHKHREKFNADVVLHLKKKRDIIEGELQNTLNIYKKIEKEYKDYIKLSEDRMQEYEDRIQEHNKKIQELREKLEYQGTINKNLEEKVALLEREIHLMMNTIGWRALTKLRRIRDKITPPGSSRRRIYEGIISPLKYRGILTSTHRTDNEYLKWLSKNEPDAEALNLQLTESLQFPDRPKISIIVPVYNTDRNMLISMLNSVLSQTYDNWELCIADGNSDIPHVKEVLSEYSDRDNRIKVTFLDKNYNIAGNSGRALETATGEFVAFLDHDDELSPFALYEVVRVLNNSGEIDIIYSDEDKINPSGKRCHPFFKPDWSPDLLTSVNYVCHLLAIRKTLLEKIGGIRDGYDGAQDYDLVLRCVSGTSKIFHIPKVLYHWRMHSESTAQNIYIKDYAHESGKKALEEYLSGKGIEAEIDKGAGITNYRINYRLSELPRVSIIIPFKDKYRLLKKCTESIINKSSYKNYELVLVSNNSAEKQLFDYLEELKELPSVRILEYNEPFNYSKLNNYAVKHSDGEVLLFLNNDTEVISVDWIESMLGHALRKETGAVGCKLLYPDNTIQHAGVVIGLTGFAGHVFSGLPGDAYTYFGSADFVRNYLAVTGACMMMRKEVFNETGGFDERFILCGSDVEICLRLIEKGYRIIYTPFAKLYHYEAKTRGKDIPHGDFKLSSTVYNKYLTEGDPYYNPNLTRLKTDCSLRSNGEEKILKEIIKNALGQS